MKVVILAGGLGTRLSEYTELMPKPMVPIGGKPIIWHIMKRYSMYGFNDFVIALGYKSSVIKKFFLDYQIESLDLKINTSSKSVEYLGNVKDNWNISLIETGDETMTGGRLLRLRPHLGTEPFMLTYGDGVADIDISKLLQCHANHKKLVTVTAVRPPARFGQITIKDGSVVAFREKDQLDEGWINGGFFVMEPEFLDYIHDDKTFLEKEPLENASKAGELMAYQHKGFWQCMDTKRDKDYLDHMINSSSAPWLML